MGNKKQIEQQEQPVHMVDLLNRIEIGIMRKQTLELSKKLADLDEAHEDLQSRFDHMVVVFNLQVDLIAKQTKQLEAKNNQLQQLDAYKDVVMMAESIFMGQSTQTKNDLLKTIERMRSKGIYVPTVEQIITGDYSMKITK